MARGVKMLGFYVWTPTEIACHVPQFGVKDGGWFYGLVRDRRGKVRLAEILAPGWAAPFWRDVLRHPLWVFRDLRRQRPRMCLETHTTIWPGAMTSTASNVWVRPGE